MPGIYILLSQPVCKRSKELSGKFISATIGKNPLAMSLFKNSQGFQVTKGWPFGKQLQGVRKGWLFEKPLKLP